TDFPTAWGRTPAGRAAREVVQRFGLAPLLHFEVETEVCGREVLDTIEPPAIFVLNHSSHLDAPTILTPLPTRWRPQAGAGGAYQAMPRGRSWPKPGRPPVRIRFGLPIRAIEGERAAAFSERLRQGLGKVLEEDHSNWWNAIRLDAAGELFDPGGPQVATWRRMWESSRPVRPSRAKSVWSPDAHEWEAEHLWSGAGWHPDAGLGTAAAPETLTPEPQTLLEPAPEPQTLTEPAHA